MTNLVAAQFIYTNVEKDISPQNRRGYQTLFATRTDLNPDDCEDLEARMLYETENSPSAKQIFFLLAGQRAVVANIVPLEETDQYGRVGRYFAHALIIKPDIFAALGNNPFALLDVFPFWTTVEEALKVGERQTGDIIHATLPLQIEDSNLIGNSLDPSNAFRFLLLASQASDLLEDRIAVHAIGTSKQILDLLRGLFALLPTKIRLQCSFDTKFSGTLSRLPYWLIGTRSGEGSQAKQNIRFDVEKGQFLTNSPYPTTTLFQHWLLQQESNTPHHSPLHDECARAFSLSCLQEGNHDNVGDEQLHRALSDVSGIYLAKRVYPEALAWFRNQKVQDLVLDHLFPVNAWLEWLVATYPDSKSLPTEAEQADLDRLTQTSDDPLLNVLVHFWAKRTDQLLAAVKTLKDSQLKIEAVLRPLGFLARQQLNTQLGLSMGRNLARYAVTWVVKEGKAALDELSEGFSAEHIAQWLGRWVLDKYNGEEQPTTEELEAIEQVASRYPTVITRVAVNFWRRQWDELSDALMKIDPKRFQEGLVRGAFAALIQHQVRAQAGDLVASRLLPTVELWLTTQSDGWRNVLSKGITADVWTEWIVATEWTQDASMAPDTLTALTSLATKLSLQIVLVLADWWRNEIDRAIERFAKMDAIIQRSPHLRSVVSYWTRMKLLPLIGAVFAAELEQYATEWLYEHPTRITATIRNGFSPRQVIDWVLKVIFDTYQKPAPDVLDSLTALSDKLPGSLLALWIWRWTGDWDSLASVIWVMPETDYKNLVEWAVETIEPQIQWRARKTPTGILMGRFIDFEMHVNEENLALIWSLCGLPQNQEEAPRDFFVDSVPDGWQDHRRISLPEMFKRGELCQTFLVRRAQILEKERKAHERKKTEKTAKS